MEKAPSSEADQHSALRILGRFTLMCVYNAVSIGAVEVVTGAVLGHPLSIGAATAVGGGGTLYAFGPDFITR